MNKRFLKLFVLCFVAMFSFVFIGCKASAPENTDQNKTDTATDSTGQNEIADTSETTTSIKSAITTAQKSITGAQTNASLPENESDYQTGVYEISSAGNYYFAGNLSGAITVNKKSGDVHLFLNGVTLSVENANAISAKTGVNLVITLMGENTLQNSKSAENGSAEHVIKAKDKLTINGSGSLTINSTKSAIGCDGTFWGLGGTLNLTAANKGITADSIYIAGSVINGVSCGGDLLHAESEYDEVATAPEFSFDRGFVYIERGEVKTATDATILGDGIQADSFVYIKGGEIDISTTPTWNDAYVATEDNEKGMYKKSGSTYEKISRESVKKGSTYCALKESVKCIKVGEIDYYLASDTKKENELEVASEKYTILIEGGELKLYSADDAIHCNSGAVIISGGDIEITTLDDGITADTTLKVMGSAVIDIKSCYEGLEAETIEISGGDTTISAIDDGVNATNSDLSEKEQAQVCQINITGGRLDVSVNPSKDSDGIDSNGGLTISGGIVITRGPNSQTASPIDASNTVVVSGGVLITIGNAPGSTGSQGRFAPGPGGAVQGGMSEGTWSISSSLVKTQSSSAGLSKGDHSITIGTTKIEYTNSYAYSGYTTVIASASATIK